MKKTGFSAVLLLACLALLAQDTHYGTNQFGTRSALLGGAVVGGTLDNSMIFYNPAAIAFIDSNSFSITANVYQVENTRIKNIISTDRDFQSLQLNSVPLLTSGQFKTKQKRWRISYGIFAPIVFQFRGLARLEGQYDVVGDAESPGRETFVGDVNLFSRLRELDVAAGTSYQINEHWAIGLTHMVAVRTQNYNRALFTHYFLNNSDQTLVSTSFTQSFNYYNARYIPKLGIAYRNANWSWGATITAPSINVLGSGAAGVDILASNVKAAGVERSTIVANSRQAQLKAIFKSPYSVAMGVQLTSGRTQWMLSANYYGKQKLFTIMQGTEVPFVRPASAENVLNSAELLHVKTAARPVLNIALGIEHPLSESWSLNASVRNNESYYDARLLTESGIKPDVTTWNLYHAVGGVTVRKPRSSMSVGLALGFGQDSRRDEQFLPQLTESNFFKTPITVTKGTYTSLGLVLGYNYFFKKG